MGGMGNGTYKLILFVSGMSVKSARAVENIKAICEAHKQHKFSLEIIDIYKEKEKASEYGVFAIPTLLKLEPAPTRIIIGDLSDKNKVLKSLNILP
jgi:circadian clock protein KaiB